MPKLGMEAIRRRQVMDAVIQILSTQGWRDLTIREVSDVAGISSGVVTHYFADKRTLTLEAVNSANLSFARALGEIRRRRGDALARLIALVDFVSQPAPPDVPDWRFWLSLLGRMPFDRLLQAEMQKMHRLFAEVTSGLIEDGAYSKDFAPRRAPADIAMKFVASTVGFASLMVADPQEMPPERCRAMLMQILLPDLGLDDEAPLMAGVGR